MSMIQQVQVRRTISLAAMIGILLLSAALAWHDLGAREVLGRDENATITKLDQPSLAAVIDVTGIKLTGQPGNMQPLYFVAQHLFWPLVERSAFMLRFLPSVFYVLTVALVYKLGDELLSRDVGLVAALLTALLPLHVRYAQIARPYSLLLMLSVASAYFLVRAQRTNRPLDWAGFVLTATLNFYTHYNSLFVLAALGLFAAAVWLETLIARIKKRKRQQKETDTGVKSSLITPRLTRPVSAFFLVGLFCAPGLVRLARQPWMGDGSPADVGYSIELTAAFLQTFLYKTGLMTPWLRALFLVLMGIGIVTALLRRRWRAVLLAILWIAIPLGVLAVMKSPRPFVERYVIFVPSLALILVGQGIVSLGDLAAGLSRKWNTAAAKWLTTAILTLALALLFISPLRAYYADNRATARLELTLAVLEHNLQPGDGVIVSPRFFVRPLAANSAEVLYLTEQPAAAELDDLIQPYQRVWFLYNSFLPPAELQEPLDQWLLARQDDYARVQIKAITALAYRDQTLLDPADNLKDRIALLEEMAEASAGKGEARMRYSLVADAYEALSELYRNQGDLDRAAEYQNKAETIRDSSSAP